MPKVELTPFLKALSGSLGETGLTFRRTKRRRGGKTIIIKRADMSNVEWSPAQVANRQEMAEAIAFAREVIADPERKKAYEKRARRKGTDAYHLAISEYRKALKKQKG
jgi:hypothetical protein